jgi:hypothetical protein
MKAEAQTCEPRSENGETKIKTINSKTERPLYVASSAWLNQAAFAAGWRWD